MIQHTQKPGVRDWYGNHLIELQGETLDAVQAFHQPFGSHILSGCAITGTPGDYDIAEGFVAINHADGFKVARLEAVTGVVLPGYLSISKATIQGQYDTAGTPFADDIAYEYTATFTTGAAPDPDDPLYLVLPSPATAAPADFAEAFARMAISEEEEVSNTAVSGDVEAFFTINKATRTVHLRAYFLFKGFSGYGTGVTELLLSILPPGVLPDKYKPATRKYFSVVVPAESPYIKDNLGLGYITTLAGDISSNGLRIRILRPAPAVSEYYGKLDIIYQLA